MIEFKNKNIYFSGRGEKIEKDELIKYFIQNDAQIVENTDDANIIIQGYMTPVYLEDKFYTLSKDGVEVITIEDIEKEFSSNLDIDSILIAIKISKDKQRVMNLLKNRYFTNEIFVKILKYYDWENVGLYDNDDNRDISTHITSRFCSLTKTNHNIQHAPIGIYYTALETSSPKLLEIIYNMPYFKISDKNAKENQPLTLKEVVALNPNSPKAVLIQILKQNNIDELKFLALNTSINKIIKDKLFSMDNKTILNNLIVSNNIEIENVDKVMQDKELKTVLLRNIELSSDTFTKIISSDLNDIEYIYLSSNLSLNSDQIDILFEKNIDSVDINLLKNKNCSKDKIKSFLSKNDKIFNITIAHNENLDDDTFIKLEKLNDFDIDITLSLNNTTPKNILTNLYNKNNNYININLSQNNNTAINILMQLQVDTRYTTYVSNNETYKEFSRTNLGIIQNDSNRIKRSTYTVN
ncbi:MAG: hypothetical protein U9N59_14950 [Campylobacterota bacterium]|nr:hypothetical protein [Campylobacterota bacterium]